MVEKKVSLMDFEGNPNVGIYMFVNDKFCLVGPDVEDSKKKEIENTLGVPVHKVSVLGTDLIGVFVSGNNDFIIVPPMYGHEAKKFEEICADADVELVVMDDIQNTFGNNVCVGEKAILINPDYSKKFETSLAKKIAKIKKAFKIVRVGMPEFNSVGSTSVFLNGKFFMSQEYSEDDVKVVLKDIAGLGTVNAGSNFVASGVVGNKFGVILGSMCSTVEIQNIIESLDYI